MTRFDKLFQEKRSQSAADRSQPKPEPVPEPIPAERAGDSLPTQSQAKYKDPSYVRTTMYLPKAVHRKLKAAAAEDEREMSDIVESLVSEWLESRSNT